LGLFHLGVKDNSVRSFYLCLKMGRLYFAYFMILQALTQIDTNWIN